MNGLIAVQKKEIGKLKKGELFKRSGSEVTYVVIAGGHGRHHVYYQKCGNENETIITSQKDEIVTIVSD